MSIKLKGSSDGSVSFDAPADTSPSGSDITLTLPTSAGSANQFLKNSGIAGELEYSSMVETSTGVGIGTSPTTPLQVHSSTTASTIRITNSTSGATSSDGLIIQESGNDTYIWNKENSFISLGTNNAERARLDSSGRLLIGTSSSFATGSGQLQLDSLSSPEIALRRNSASSGSNSGRIAFYSSVGLASTIEGLNDGAHSGDNPGRLVFSTTANSASSPTERMRITSGGCALINGTGVVSRSQPVLFQVGEGSNSFGIQRNNSLSVIECVVEVGTTTARTAHAFKNPNGFVGTININSNSTSYNTSSDYRLKENVVALDGAITRVKQLLPKRFNFITDSETTVDGFLAHEAQAVVPEAVSGTHNEVDDDGNAVMQGIDQSKLVPLLTAALQEAIAKIETLETKVAALEAA